MRAVVYRDFGTPDVLRVEEVAKPVPADDEVLVAVRAAAVNTFDWYMVRGKPAFFRLLLGSGKKPLGVDLAGEVQAVGRNVMRFKPGDRVFGTGRDKMRAKRGSFAEYVSVPERALAIMPRNTTFAQAAAVPVVGLTALQGLRDRGRVEHGQKVTENGRDFSVDVHARVLTNDPTLNIQLARAGAGLSLADGRAGDDIARGDLVTVLEQFSIPFPGFYLYYPQRRHTSPPLRAFIEFLRRVRRS